MKRFSTLMLFTALLCGLSLATGAGAADEANGPPPRQEGGAGGPPPGYHLLPRFTLEKLNLTDDQQKQVAALEQEVKDKLAKILTADQMKTLETARPPRRGPGGNGGGQGG